MTKRRREPPLRSTVRELGRSSVLFAVDGSGVELVTWAVFVIQPPPLPVMVVVTVNDARWHRLASDARLHVRTLVADV